MNYLLAGMFIVPMLFVVFGGANERVNNLLNTGIAEEQNL